MGLDFKPQNKMLLRHLQSSTPPKMNTTNTFTCSVINISHLCGGIFSKNSDF